MKILKKDYRITWDENKIMQCDPNTNYSGSQTFVPDRFDSFESDSLDEVQNKIQELGLIEPEERIPDELL